MKTKLMQLADAYASIPGDTYYMDTKADARAALEAEIDRVTAERDALRAAAQAGLKELLKYPRETRTVWKDGIDLDLPYPNKTVG